MSEAGPKRIGVAIGWHGLDFETLLERVRQAEALGFEAVYVDGDVSQLASRGDGDVLDGWTVTTALLARTERIQIGSIRLVHHWNAARLAQAVSTLERIVPGRLRLLMSIGGQPADRRFGLHLPSAADRVAWLEEMLDAACALWRGEEVSRDGRFVTLDRARVRPVPPPGRPRIEIAGRGPGLLRLAARHAADWDINLPPLDDRVARATERLEAACQSEGRDPASLERSMWIFARPHGEPGSADSIADYRRFNPWFADVADEQIHDAMLTGPAASCRVRLAEIADRLRLDLPVVDLSGLDGDATRRALDALGTGA
ncbi:MAG: LLM class flavin-dependent oxidoreductase [Myxococcota bacterium]|nr:LLM class flavin-dependent oxidoreductase [Myxococcota bacterium]